MFERITGWIDGVVDNVDKWLERMMVVTFLLLALSVLLFLLGMFGCLLQAVISSV